MHRHGKFVGQEKPYNLRCRADGTDQPNKLQDITTVHSVVSMTSFFLTIIRKGSREHTYYSGILYFTTRKWSEYKQSLTQPYVNLLAFKCVCIDIVKYGVCQVRFNSNFEVVVSGLEFIRTENGT